MCCPSCVLVLNITPLGMEPAPSKTSSFLQTTNPSPSIPLNITSAYHYPTTYTTTLQTSISSKTLNRISSHRHLTLTSPPTMQLPLTSTSSATRTVIETHDASPCTATSQNSSGIAHTFLLKKPDHPPPPIPTSPPFVPIHRSGHPTTPPRRPSNHQPQPAINPTAVRTPFTTTTIPTAVVAEDVFSISDQELSDAFAFVKEVGFGNWGSVWLCKRKLKGLTAGAKVCFLLVVGGFFFLREDWRGEEGCWTSLIL